VSRQRRARIPRQLNARSGLDGDALKYAALLDDPCNAPLVHPTYSGSEGGYLARFETINTYGIASGTTTSGLIHWIPGQMLISGGVNAGTIYNEATGPGVSNTMASEVLAQTPGGTFLSTNASAFRCVAACITISWPGTELARQGYVAVGNTSGVTLKSGVSIAPGSVFPLLTHSERVPMNKIELKWRPGAFDETFSDASSSPSVADLSRAGAITVYYVGLPAGGAGLLIKRTAVYEYIPNIALGLATVPSSRSKSNNTLDQVVNFLDSTGDWVTRAAGSVYRLTSRVAPLAITAAKALPALML